MNNLVSVKVLKDSIYSGHRLTTLELEYPRYIHSEVMTYRVFSRNAQSSRAIPVAKSIERIRQDKWYPIFMKNKPGMEATEVPTEEELRSCRMIWDIGREKAIKTAELFLEYNIHKQNVNRVLEPYSKIKVILSATEFNNFFRQRLHNSAQQEIQLLAKGILEAMRESNPKKLDIGQWHLPFLQESEEVLDTETQIMLSVARCARVSYLNHDGKRDDNADLELFRRLKRDLHLSPFEHAATPCPSNLTTANFKGWRQYRFFVENDVENV